MKVEVRAMAAVDIPSALRLWSSTEGIELSEGDAPEEIARYLARSPGVSTVACVDGRVIAAVMCGHDGRRGFVYHLAVAPDFRGRGVARRVMKRSLERLKDAGIHRALLFVETGNTGGQQFWLKESWTELSFARPFGIDL